MIQIDGISRMGLSIDNILSMDRSRVSDVKLFAAFAEGIKIDDEFLFNERWTQSGAAPQTNPIDFVMFEMLPSSYDLDILEKMGGSLGFRISGVGDYTFISLNNRVVTLSGLPIDFETNNEVLNCEISPDVFMGFCRGLLLDVADDMLEKDDEFESRVVSDGELIFNGMPSGGFAVDESAGTDFGASMASVRAHNIGTVNDSGVATGYISSARDEDWIAVHLDSHSTYNVSLQGDTLTDPYLKGIYNAEGVTVHGGNDDGPDGHGLNSLLNFSPSESGVYYISAGAFSSHTGSYTMSVTADLSYRELLAVNEPANSDFGASMASVRANNIGTVNGSGEATGYISSTGDQDWIAVMLDSQSTYNVSLQGDTLRDPELKGIYNAEGVRVHGGNDDGGDGHGLNSQLNFSPSESGVYYISAGGYGNNKGSYTMSVTAESVTPMSVTARSVPAMSVTAELDAGFSHSACVAASTLGILADCGANASFCQADFTVVPLGGGVLPGRGVIVGSANENLSPCAADAVACGADFGFDLDVGFCTTNVLPVYPSC